MTPERWKQIDNLFQEAVHCPVAERASLLDAAGAIDKDLRKEVESLLSFREQADAFLEVPVLEATAELICEGRLGSICGQVIGPYKIEAPLGFGGMGEVYLAEDLKLDRKVAIKFLPSYLEANDLAKRRLLREAKAAAKLDHPNICAVYEVKEEPDRTFIVMQYVAGETLADKIKTEPMELRQTLDVTIQVVEALAEAHSRGIVHRDVKPGNIMITPRGQVKVLDFGLAKIIDAAPDERPVTGSQTMLSKPGDRPGTPPYMSPEQARGKTVDARGDLFAVGVILYESVAGTRPFLGNTTKEILNQVRNYNPPPPSNFNPHVPPLLDALTLKALAKNPGTRYQSAEELLDDLRGVRASLQTQDQAPTRPILLKRDTSKLLSVLTTLSNAFRRRPIFISTTGGVLCLALLAFFIVVIVAPRLRGYQPAPAAARWYDVGTSALRNGAYFEASKALRQAVTADDKFALAHARLAEAYTELDYSDKAKDEIIRAESLARELPLRRADSLYLKAVTNTVLRDFSPAIESYQQIARQAPDKERASVYLDLGRAYEKNDQLREAKENYQEATKLAPQEAAAFLRLGVVCGELHDFTCASDAFQKAESLYQALSNLEGVTEVFCQRGFLFIYEIKPPEARAQLEKALEMTKASGNQFQLIRVLLALSRISELEGHITQAQQQATEAIQLARNYGIENQATGGLVWLGNTFLLRGDYGNAEKYYQQALQLAQRDKMLFNEAWALTQLGSLRSMQHKTEETLSYVEKPFAFFKERGYRKMLAWILTLMGRADRDKGDYDAALKAFRDLHQLGEQLGDQAQVGLADDDIGNILSYEEQYSEALRHFNESYGIFKSLKVDVYMAYAAQSRASVLWQLGRSEEARAALDEATSIAQRAEHPEETYKPLLAYIHLTDSRLELSAWQLQESKVKSQKALDLAGTQYPDIAVEAKNTLALAQVRSGAPRTGMVLCTEALEIARGTGDPQLLADSLLSCAEVMLVSGDLQRALDTALQARETFARFGKQDSDWRASLIAAQAGKRLGKEAEVREYVTYANNRFAELEQKWGLEAYHGYLQRLDIMHFRNQLDQLLNP